MDIRRMRHWALCIGAGLVFMPQAVLAQADYPSRPVEMTVLFGGTANTISQLLVEGMSKELDGPVVAVARTGGGGVIGYSHVQSSPPDGYNIITNSNSINTLHHLGMLPFGYDQFEPVAQVSVEVPVLVVNADSDWTNLQEMAEAVAGSGQRINVGISGRGSFTHVASAALFDAMGISDNVNFVPYGDGNAPVEVLAGRIHAAVQWPGQIASYVETDQLRLLGALGTTPIQSMPDLQSAADQGYDLDIAMWRGLAVPKGTPPEVIARLQDAAKVTVESQTFQQAARNIGFEPAFLAGEEFQQVVSRDDAFYADLLANLGLAK